MRGNLYIPSIDAKDLFLVDDYSLYKRDGSRNLKRYVNSFDYSLDLIQLRSICKRGLSFFDKGKEYSDAIVNVTFKYSVKEWNRINANTYIKYGYPLSDFEGGVAYNEYGEVVGVKLGEQYGDDDLPPYFALNEEGEIVLGKTIPTIKTARELREELYENGFMCNGEKYCRFKRSSGSARVGKCLFIRKNLYAKMQKSESCGLNFKEGDLAAYEAYISLPTSSIIDTLTISPQNILVVDDYESVFKESCVNTVMNEDKELYTSENEVDICNSIWDGQSLIDVSLMGKYASKGMILLRNKFFKSCCFNTNIQQFFADNGITDLSQLNGTTLATDISDVKLITTPSSIKYFKFGKFEDWCKNIYKFFGVVKYDKDTHYFGGNLVQTHYQLINTLQLSESEVEQLVKPSLEYLDLLHTDVDAMRYHIKCQQLYDESNVMIDKNEIVYKLLNKDCGFEDSKIYFDFKRETCKAYLQNIRKGHILVNGTYATLLGNPYEMLLQSIGKFDGTSTLPIGCVHNIRFDYNKKLLGSRSPHVACGNILVVNNIACEEIDKYFNLTNNIICINSIGENILQRLSGADFDSDTMLITDNKILLDAAIKNYKYFKVPTNCVEAKKIKRKYCSEDLADLDNKTGNNLIGEIVNLSQELNSLMWEKIYQNGGDLSTCYDKIKDIYYDACQLDVMSGIEIDSAKKEFEISNSAELKKMRSKYEEDFLADDGRKIKPKFLGFIAKTKGYYNSEKKLYQNHNTSMDYLQRVLNRRRSKHYNNSPQLPICEMFKPDDYKEKNVLWGQVKKVLTLTEDIYSKINKARINKNLSYEEIRNQVRYYKEYLCWTINQLKINKYTMYQLIKKADRSILFEALFNYRNEMLIEMLADKPNRQLELVIDDEGDINIYGLSFKKAPKM